MSIDCVNPPYLLNQPDGQAVGISPRTEFGGPEWDRDDTWSE